MPICQSTDSRDIDDPRLDSNLPSQFVAQRCNLGVIRWHSARPTVQKRWENRSQLCETRVTNPHPLFL